MFYYNYRENRNPIPDIWFDCLSKHLCLWYDIKKKKDSLSMKSSPIELKKSMKLV